jgi:hypothetical protein
MAGPAPQYLAKFDGHVLPGYVQSESFDSELNIADHYAAYIDGSISEDTGLANKAVSIRFKVWEDDYLSCKEQIQLAATMLRSVRNKFAPLYVGYTDRHYMAMTKSINMAKSAGESVKLAEYDVAFECKPWIIGDTLRTLTGTGTISTDQVNRDIYNGSTTPTVVTITGSNVTISGYTETGDFTGYFAVSGDVIDLVVNSENFTAYTASGTNMNESMLTVDYQLHVGVGKTNFLITGASDCTIEYYDRWYL